MILKEINLYDYQEDAVNRLESGSILNGATGSGKSFTALTFWQRKYKDRDLYIITTARKRDNSEWLNELSHFDPSTNFTIDSWNNIEKYKDIKDSFFIFDEQKAIGYGKWSKTFIKIAKVNKWIMLSATPGDTWLDYAPVFIANGFYKNKSDFVMQHVMYSNFSRFPQVKGYFNCKKLVNLRDKILVNIDYTHKVNVHITPIITDHDREDMRTVVKDYWNIYEGRPIENPSEHYYMARKVANIHYSRLNELDKICQKHRKVVVFYTFNYELEAIEKWAIENDKNIFQWNGHKHEDIPPVDLIGSWIYLVQYSSGAEGWNCTDTNVIVFYSLNPSFKQSLQAAGRIDRCNTPFKDLYYYVFMSDSYVDKSICNALKNKRSFNHKDFEEGLKQEIHTL